MTHPLKEKANFLRVCQLLIDQGSDALRITLHAIHPPSTLAAVLHANKTALQKIRYSVIKQSQWDLLFPVFGVPDSNNFDITLLTILLRNICGLPSPATGWDVMPPVSDSSTSAHIARIKIFRNDVYGHIPAARLNESTFETLWQDISKSLIKLGIPQQEINELKEATFSLEEDNYIQKLKEWKELEDNIKSKLNDVERTITKLQKTVEHEHLQQMEQLARFDFTGKIAALCTKFYTGTRQWFFDKLSNWFGGQTSRVMILTAGPGAGKSVLSAKICDVYRQRSQLAAYHFCDFRNSDSRNPQRILQSLASQMCDNVEGFRDKLAEVLRREHSRDSLSDAFRVLLSDPLHALDRRERMLMVVDALDESKTEVRSDFLELISDEVPELPEWIKIFITSRPELQVRKKLQHLNPQEITPDNDDHNLDIERFILHCLPKVYIGNVHSLSRNCEGSFLYAYYFVNELKDLGIEPTLSCYAPKGISGFYEKQFKRFKTDLQRLQPDACSSILKCFLNVIASSKAPIPIKVLFACMGLSDEEFEIRQTIIGIMSEIFPLYEGCITVYHKSLLDWLVLDGYEEHAFKADVADGNTRLWHFCKSKYSEINSLKSVSDFQMSSEGRYALQNGGNLLLEVGATADFHWLVNVRVNYLKLKFFNTLDADVAKILQMYGSEIPDPIFRAILQLAVIIADFPSCSIKFHAYQYLQTLASGFSDTSNSQMTTNYKQEARNILEKSNMTWLEEVRSECNSYFKIISYNVIGTDDLFYDQFDYARLSPDNKLLACVYGGVLEVFNLPSLKPSFRLETNAKSSINFLIFSPDSSYILINSVRTCISLTEQKEVPFIPHGPEDIICCSFSPCGLKLVTVVRKLTKVWDVRTKDLLVKVENLFEAANCQLSKCDSYIIAVSKEQQYLFDFPTSTWLVAKENCTDTCLTYQDHFELILSSDSREYFEPKSIRIRHVHFPTSEKLLVSINTICSKPFIWKDKKCVLLSESFGFALPLMVYDFINNEIIDVFHIKCFPNNSKIVYMTNLDEAHFLICLDSCHLFLLSCETSQDSLKASFLNFTDVDGCALSPNNLHIACCYKNVLTVRCVDTGETLQTVELKQPLKACWWSDVYLWVVCEGVVVKYPYDSTRTNVLGSELEECIVHFDEVLRFEKDVLVIRHKEKITILKFSNEELSPQIFSMSSSHNSATISSDGCAVLLCNRDTSDYQLWEITCENKWELHQPGRFGGSRYVEWLFLTGTANCRSSLWLSKDVRSSVYLSSVDLSNNSHLTTHLHNVQVKYYEKVIYGDSKYLIIADLYGWIHFVEVSTDKITASIYLGHFTSRRWAISSFYIPSRSLLVLIGETEINTFKIHNVEKY